MIPRSLLTILVLALPVLVVSLAVLLAAAGLTAAIGDAPAASVLTWIGIGCGLLLLVNIVLLLCALGVRALEQADDDQHSGLGN